RLQQLSCANSMGLAPSTCTNSLQHRPGLSEMTRYGCRATANPLDQRPTAVDNQHLSGAIGLLHQIEISLSDSCASPTCLTGSFPPVCLKRTSRSASGMFAQSGVLTIPGATTLTRIGASSTANARVSPSMAEQMLAPSDQPDRGRMLARPDVKTIEPPCRMLPLPYLAAI